MLNQQFLKNPKKYEIQNSNKKQHYNNEIKKWKHIVNKRKGKIGHNRCKTLCFRQVGHQSVLKYILRIEYFPQCVNLFVEYKKGGVCKIIIGKIKNKN